MTTPQTLTMTRITEEGAYVTAEVRIDQILVYEPALKDGGTRDQNPTCLHMVGGTVLTVCGSAAYWHARCMLILRGEPDPEAPAMQIKDIG